MLLRVTLIVIEFYLKFEFPNYYYQYMHITLTTCYYACRVTVYNAVALTTANAYETSNRSLHIGPL
jgi:hypothetical protein